MHDASNSGRKVNVGVLYLSHMICHQLVFRFTYLFNPWDQNPERRLRGSGSIILRGEVLIFVADDRFTRAHIDAWT